LCSEIEKGDYMNLNSYSSNSFTTIVMFQVRPLYWYIYMVSEQDSSIFVLIDDYIFMILATIYCVSLCLSAIQVQIYT
jgi:hypothetical protein